MWHLTWQDPAAWTLGAVIVVVAVRVWWRRSKGSGCRSCPARGPGADRLRARARDLPR